MFRFMQNWLEYYVRKRVDNLKLLLVAILLLAIILGGIIVAVFNVIG